MIRKGLIIGLDFDGTVVTHEYPAIGKPLPNCIETLKRCLSVGALICLNTMRSGIPLAEAVEYLEENGITLWGINCNPDQKRWTDSTKVYAHVYIDDAALGTLTIHDPSFSDRPYVDWVLAEALLFPEE